MKVPVFVLTALLGLASAVMIWEVNILREIDQRLTRVETKVEMLAPAKHQ